MKLKRYLSVFSAAAVIAAASCVDENVIVKETPSYSERSSSFEFVPDELLVKFKSEGLATGRAADVLSAIDGRIVETIVDGGSSNGAGRNGDGSGKLLLVSSKLGTMEAIARLKNNPDVEFAEPNFIYHHFSNDPLYANGSLWGMYGDNTTPANQYGSQAGETWATVNATERVWVGIIDEGYMYTHEDLSVNAAKNPGEIAGNNLDDDGNGYVDDVYGWDFDGNNNTVFDGVADDHGTHVAGTIGASGDNGKGVAGVIWNVNLLNAKFLGKRGGTTANAIKAVDYFTNLKSIHGINVVATSNSWGGGGYSQALQEAIARAGAANILFVAAAGNDGRNIDSSPSYPASYTNDNIISVASLDSRGALSGFSNYGAQSVDLAAPGSAIYSTVPRRSGSSVISGYASYSGTSMATPHVTGAVAVYAAGHPGATAASIKAAVLQSASATSSLSNKCATGGRLNVSDLLNQPM